MLCEGGGEEYVSGSCCADVLEICQSFHCTEQDQEEFLDYLEKLTKHCSYSVDGDEDNPSLLIL